MSGRPGRGGWIAWVLVILAALAFGAALAPFTETWYYVCRECGNLRHTREKQLPWMGVTWWTTHRYEETLLSRLLRESGHAVPHEHSWFPGEGSGNGVSYRFVGLDMRKDAESGHVVAFLRHLVHQGNRERFLEWKAAALAPDPGGRRLEKALRDAGFPAEGFGDAATFDHWFQGAWR